MPTKKSSTPAPAAPTPTVVVVKKSAKTLAMPAAGVKAVSPAAKAEPVVAKAAPVVRRVPAKADDDKPAKTVKKAPVVVAEPAVADAAPGKKKAVESGYLPRGMDKGRRLNQGNQIHPVSGIHPVSPGGKYGSAGF